MASGAAVDSLVALATVVDDPVASFAAVAAPMASAAAVAVPVTSGLPWPLPCPWPLPWAPLWTRSLWPWPLPLPLLETFSTPAERMPGGQTNLELVKMEVGAQQCTSLCGQRPKMLRCRSPHCVTGTVTPAVDGQLMCQDLPDALRGRLPRSHTLWIGKNGPRGCA